MARDREDRLLIPVAAMKRLWNIEIAAQKLVTARDKADKATAVAELIQALKPAHD